MITVIQHPTIGDFKKAFRARQAATLAVFLFCLVSARLFADDGMSPLPPAAGTHLGFYYAFPAYLYDRYSASGVQLGYEQGNLHVRLDLSLASGYQDGRVFLFTNPSLGVFYSETWPSRIRTYQGIACGGETGILNAFDGQAFFLNFMMGAECLVSEKKAVYLEIGSGLGIPHREGAFNGGTVIGGGFKSFF